MYLEPNQTSEMEFFAKTVNDGMSFAGFAEICLRCLMGFLIRLCVGAYDVT